MYALKDQDRVIAFFATEDEAKGRADGLNNRPDAYTNQFKVEVFTDVEVANFLLSGIDAAHHRLDSHHL